MNYYQKHKSKNIFNKEKNKINFQNLLKMKIFNLRNVYNY